MPGRPALRKIRFGLISVPAVPETRVEIAAADAHGQGSPHNGFDMHDSGNGAHVKPAKQPFHPVQINGGSPAANTNIDMMSKADTLLQSPGETVLGGDQAARPFGHMSRTPVFRGFGSKLKTVGKVEVRIEKKPSLSVPSVQEKADR